MKDARTSSAFVHLFLQGKAAQCHDFSLVQQWGQLWNIKREHPCQRGQIFELERLIDAWSFVQFFKGSGELLVQHAVDPAGPFPPKPRQKVDEIQGITERILLDMASDGELWERQLHQHVPVHRALPACFSQLPSPIIKSFQDVWFGSSTESTPQAWNSALECLEGSPAAVTACASEVLREMRRRRCGPTGGTFVALAHLFGRLPPPRRLAAVPRLWPEACLTLGRKDGSVATAILAALLPDSDAAADFLATLLVDGPPPDELTATTLLADVTHTLQILRRLAVYDWAGDPSTIVSFGEVLLTTAAGKPAGALQDTFTLYGGLCHFPGFSPSPAIVSFLLQCAASPDHFWVGWRAAQRLGPDCLPGGALRDCLRRVLAARPPLDFTLAVAAELRPHGQVGALLAALPDVGHLAALHAAHPLGPAELWAALGRLWPGEAGRRLRRGGGPATVEAYNSVMEACGKDPVQALELYRDMEAQGLQPDERTHELLLAAHIEAGDRQRAVDLLHQLRRGRWTAGLYSSLLRLAANDYSECHRLVEEMPSRNLPVGIEALELLAAALPTAASPAAAARQLLLRAHEAGVAVSHPLLWRCASCLPTVLEVKGLFSALQRLRPDTPGDAPNHALLLGRLLGQGLGPEAAALLMAMAAAGLVPAAAALRPLAPLLAAAHATAAARAALAGPYPAAGLGPLLRAVGPLGADPAVIEALASAAAAAAPAPAPEDFFAAAFPDTSAPSVPLAPPFGLWLASVASPAMPPTAVLETLPPLTAATVGYVLAAQGRPGDLPGPARWWPLLRALAPTPAPAKLVRPAFGDGDTDSAGRQAGRLSLSEAVAQAWLQRKGVVAPRSPPGWPQRRQQVEAPQVLLLQFANAFDEVARRRSEGLSSGAAVREAT